MQNCSVCLEEQDDTFFICPTSTCQYQVCKLCAKEAFGDSTGENYDKCQLCKEPTGQLLMEHLCGKELVRAVERELRPKIVFELQADTIKKTQRREAMVKFEGRAISLFQDLCEILNMKCPRCNVVFADYDGCNALSCRVTSCGAAFCAVCLQDCGQDAHEHVRSQHGDLHDRDAFHQASKERVPKIMQEFMQSIKDEPFEVKEIVKINFDKIYPEAESNQGEYNGNFRFLEDAKKSLEVAMRNDRMSILNNAATESFKQEDISPRNAIPSAYRLSLTCDGSSVCRITLLLRKGTEWQKISLPSEEKYLDVRNDRPEVDALFNIRRSIQCGVIAFRNKKCLYQSWTTPCYQEKRLEDDEVSVMFQCISDDGNLDGELATLKSIHPDQNGDGNIEVDILGINPNRRMTLLERHVQAKKKDELLFDPLRHFIGMGKPKRFVTDIIVQPPDTFYDLNEHQKRVAHPLSLTTAMEVVGPPGSGKTKTILELVRSILECTEHDVIILSERNGSIDAIAEKFADECLRRASESSSKTEITDVSLWLNLLSFGSGGSMGASTKLFTMNEKLMYHPDLIESNRVLEAKKKDFNSLTKQMLNLLSNEIHNLDEGNSEFSNRARFINTGFVPGLSKATEVVATVKNALKSIELFNDQDGSESNYENLVIEHSSVLGKILLVRTSEEKTMYSWAEFKKDYRIHQVLFRLAASFKRLLATDMFSLEKAEAAQSATRKAESDLIAAKARIEMEMLSNPRVLMATIGSSHKLPVKADAIENIRENLDTLDFNREYQRKRTVVIFDEAGCIPIYEFLGLSRLGRDIDCLVCVGDKNQLPPYDPTTGKGRPASSEGMKSLLDASGLSINCGKIKLTTQYRVPRDIASLLNDRIYKGDYKTAPECGAPLQGFHLIHVPASGYDKKYENKNESEQCFKLVQKSIGVGSIMVLTPYKKQQRLLEFEFKKKTGNLSDKEREKYSAIPILTIDQCQGQEADIVIISLVQRPTRFLNINRLNVALSRMRKKLYFLVDRRKFEEECENDNWECSQIAKDLLELAGSY